MELIIHKIGLRTGYFSKIITVDLRQIDNPIKFSTIYDDCNEDIRNVTIFDQQQIAVTGCTYNAYCTGDRCNIQSNDMFEKEPVVSSSTNRTVRSVTDRPYVSRIILYSASPC